MVLIPGRVCRVKGNGPANIGGTIIGAPIVGQQLAQYILTDHQDADCRTMIRLILSRQL